MPVTTRGLLVGRGADCDIVLLDPRVSRRQALVMRSSGGLVVIALAKTGLVLNGRHEEREAPLAAGDTLELPGATLRVEVAAEPAPVDTWFIEHGGGRVRIAGPSFSVGGHTEDDLVVPGWPTAAVTLHSVHAGLAAEVSAPMQVAGVLMTEEMHAVRDGDVISLGDVRLRLVRSGGGPSATTAQDTSDPLPAWATLEFMPNGGLLRVRLQAEYAVFLAGRRCDLVAALLRPPGGEAGAFVADHVLIPRIWGSEGATRAQLNTLIFRTRQTLTAAGLNGALLLGRAPGGGAVRFLLAERAVVEVR